MEDRRVQDQRYVPNQKKMDEMDKLAVLGKVEKSLQRRYHNQDATMKPAKDRKLSEKPPPYEKGGSEKK